MKMEERYECDHLKDETLEIVHMYSDKLGVVQSQETGKKIVCAHKDLEPPHLCLAHVSNMQTEMRLKTEKIKWS